MKFKEFIMLPIIILIGIRIQNEILDEIKPNRLNSTWYGLPYIGRSYVRKCQKERIR